MQSAHPRTRGKHGAHRLRARADRGSSPARAGNTRSASWCGTRSAAHPRTRGKHVTLISVDGGGTGSSPHARETHCGDDLGSTFYRLIPARAGNTLARSRLYEAIVGSSPHARETYRAPRPLELVRRLIPARAGNTDCSGSQRGLATAHPRTRGKHEMVKARKQHTCGSSPHARETHVVLSIEQDPERLIPARAGNTRPRLISTACRSAHPRTRGKHRSS